MSDGVSGSWSVQECFIDGGQFDPKGDYPSSAEETRDLMREAADQMAGDGNRPPGHILMYAHSGLNTIKGSAARVGKWRDVFNANRIRQIHYIWETGLLASIKDVLLGKEMNSPENGPGG
jgi:hypothetical protein